MKRVSVCVLVAAAAVLWVGLARAERESEYASPGFGAAPKPQPKPAPPRPAMFAAASAANAKRMPVEQREERRFLKDAAAASRFESEASKLALGKSNDPAVRSFAATLINHHASTGTVLQHMLHGRGMAPPMLENDQRKVLNRLAKLHGAKFDREYLDEVGLKYQQEDVAAYEKAGFAARDPALKAWIGKTLPTLRYHLATAERITAAAEARMARAGSRATGPAQSGRQAGAPPGTQNRFGPRTELATQFMGAGPMQLGTTQPVAAHPTESNNR